MEKANRTTLGQRVHIFSSFIALFTILTFFTTTITVELVGSLEAVRTVKRLIPWGLLLLVPAMAAVGSSGLRLSGGRRTGLIGVKLRRMKIIAANGLLILVPSAIFLAGKASAGAFDTLFYAVQLLELAAGGANLFLMGRNAVDGFKLSGRRLPHLFRPALHDRGSGPCT